MNLARWLKLLGKIVGVATYAEILKESGSSIMDPSQSSQPSEEDLEKVNQQAKPQKGMKPTKKQQWGPIIPVRRSTRILDNGKSMLDKAQEAKRKRNLERNDGKKKTSVSGNSDSLLQVAKEIGIDFVIGNSNIVSQMIDLDNRRSKTSKVECKVSGCGSSPNTGLVVENLGPQSDNSSKTPTQTNRIVGAEMEEDILEKGWSKVGPRKKNRRKK